MFEPRGRPLASRWAFAGRLFRHGVIATLVVAVALGIGVLGYHYFEDLSWLDALENASMILGGMGPVSEMRSDAGKLFASAYALFCGLVFIGVMGIVLAPVAHRLLHAFHLEEDEDLT
jgi:hypothetical protein